MNAQTAYTTAQQAIATAVRTAPADAICTILTTQGPRSIVKRDGEYRIVDVNEETVGVYGSLVAAHSAVHAA